MLAAAVEADLVSHVSLLYETVGQVHREDGTVWFVSGGHAAHENGVLRATLPRWRREAAVRRLLEPFRDRQLPMMWWVFEPPATGISRLDRLLRRHGLSLTSDLPGMAMDLDAYAAPPVPQELEVRRVTDASELAVWARIVGRAFESRGFEEGLSVRGFAARGFDDRSPFRHFLCLLDGQWVGAATLSTGAGVAGLSNIAVVPEVRGRGIGTAVASVALSEAQALGLRTAVLSAEEAGRRLYERLGFREVSRHRTYVDLPG